MTRRFLKRAAGGSFVLVVVLVLVGCSGSLEPPSQAEEGLASDEAASSESVEPAEEPSPAPPNEPSRPRATGTRDVENDAPAPASSEPPPLSAPEIFEVEVPRGTILELELLTPLDSSVSRIGDEIQARTLSPLYVKGEQVLGSGAYVEGRVILAEASGRVKGKARLGFTFDRLRTSTGVETIRTSFVEQEAESGKKKDAAVIGGAAGVGAVVGGILGGKKGAAIGATIGGAGGTGVVLSTKGEEIRLPAGSQFNVRLEEPITVAVN